MATREEMKRMLGQNESQGQAFLKLNEVQMSGDDGHFYLREVLTRKEGEKAEKIDLGTEIKGVILRMRWKLSKYKEEASGGTFISSTEYDNKNTDEVTIYPDKEKGSVPNLKQRYALATQRVIYYYLPERNETVRFVVKSSAMTNENNPKEKDGAIMTMGLFEYQASLGDLLLNEVITLAKGIYREDPNGNKRKNYYATIFENAGTVEDYEKMAALTEEIYGKTTKDATRSTAESTPPQQTTGETDEDILANIPF